MYDYLIVGAGLSGATMARELTDAGNSVLVIDRREHIAGNAFTEEQDGIMVHRYGAHIFHTDDQQVWDYVRQFARFNGYHHMPVANYKGEIYALPFNMHTFNRMWGCLEPEGAQVMINRQRSAIRGNPKNLEEQAISLVGQDLYGKLIKGYTEKQWGRECRELPASIIRRIPVRFTYDNSYFDDVYQGIPEGGYTEMIRNMLDGIQVELGVDYLKNRERLRGMAKAVIFTGQIDAYFDYCYGPLEYRKVRFDTIWLDQENYQGNAVVNYTDSDATWTRIIEHKWFTFGRNREGEKIKHTVISAEYSEKWEPGAEPYYPINDEKNELLRREYMIRAANEPGVIFMGRLGRYWYADMDDVIAAALRIAEEIINNGGNK